MTTSTHDSPSIVIGERSHKNCGTQCRREWVGISIRMCNPQATAAGRHHHRLWRQADPARRILQVTLSNSLNPDRTEIDALNGSMLRLFYPPSEEFRLISVYK